MKKTLKLLLILFCLGDLGHLISCKKSQSVSAANATIIGMDAATCPCCGGFKVDIDHVYSPTDGYFLTNSMPPGSGITDSSHFPIRVKIVWKIDTTASACKWGHIDIISLSRE